MPCGHLQKIHRAGSVSFSCTIVFVYGLFVCDGKDFSILDFLSTSCTDSGSLGVTFIGLLASAEIFTPTLTLYDLSLCIATLHDTENFLNKFVISISSHLSSSSAPNKINFLARSSSLIAECTAISFLDNESV